ncbi:putative serine/threonine protein kinase [Leptodontidium sp. MPI-SDFR-AT-0119]|nr:putative serine/threonine protein kinase [Leptodontidium sp. MPI-SDFR-AT-0119]
MSSLYRLSQVLKGSVGEYVISKQVHDTVWFALNRSSQEQVVIKAVPNHYRVQHERDLLRQFEGKVPHLRPIIDEIRDPAEPLAIALRHLDDDLYNASKQKMLNRKELKYVSKRILESLKALHQEDVKLDNILVNYGTDDADNRFSAVELSDLGSCSQVDSKFAKECHSIGAPLWRSPEVLVGVPWNTATDIWSFGLCLISLIYGGEWHILRPKVSCDHEDFDWLILVKMFKWFGPIPAKYQELIGDNEDSDSDKIIQALFNTVPKDDRDRDLILKIMKMDPRDRPTAEELLQDPWFELIEEAGVWDTFNKDL